MKRQVLVLCIAPLILRRPNITTVPPRALTVSGPANVTGHTKPNWNSASLKSVIILKLGNLYTY
jgi:hypothetical protein